MMANTHPGSALSAFPSPAQSTKSISLQETAYERLMAAPIPDREIREILNLHESLTLYELMDGFDTITSKLLHWLESAHLAVFTLEQNVKEDTMEPKETQPLTEVVNRMEPYIGMLIEIGEALEEKYEDQDDQDMANRLSSQRRREAAKSAITKIQYEWSGLQHFLASVIKQVDCANEKKELIRVMERVSLEMDDMSTMIFQFQERRHAVAMATSSSTFTSDTPQQSAISENEKWLQQKGEDILAEIDSKVEPLFHEIERVHARMKSGTLPVDRSGVLAKKHLMVQEKWEYFRIDLSELKNDVKEERWQAIFRQVANEVDTMIEGLDKAAIQCHNVIQQVRDWHATLGSQTNPSPGSFDRFSRSLLRSTTRSAATATPVAAPPLDREKFRAVAVSFEAKYKYYTPNIDRMLTMLASGIASRASQHSTTQKRHQSMLQRWNGLKAVMDDLRTHDLVDTERLLIERQASPEQRVDRNHNNWKGIRYRPDQESIETRSRSPYGTKPTVSPSSKAKTNTKLKSSPRVSPYTSIDDGQRARSATPSGRASSRASSQASSYASSTYTGSTFPSTTNTGWRSLSQAANTPVSALSPRSQRTASPMMFGQTNQHQSHVGSTLRPSTSDTSSVGSSTIPDRPASRRTKTPGARPAWSSSTKTEKQDFSTLDPLWKGEDKAVAEEVPIVLPARKSRVPATATNGTTSGEKKEASWMKPTKSTIMRKRAQSIDKSSAPVNDLRPKTPVARAKTPNPGYMRAKTPTPVPTRPKSSMGRQDLHRNNTYLSPVSDRERAASPAARRPSPSRPPPEITSLSPPTNRRPTSPIRRAATPSMIPRPKTPSSSDRGGFGFGYRANSPSVFTRPRSSMLHLPPVPQLPNSSDLRSYTPMSQVISSNDSSDDYLSTTSSFLSVPHSSPPSSKSGSPPYPRELLKKQSMPMLAHHSPLRPTHIPTPRTPPPQSCYGQDSSDDEPGFKEQIYKPNKKDPLDIEVAAIVNANPVPIQCERVSPGVGRYYFGNELSPTLVGGKKMYTCKLMNYAERDSRRGRGQKGPRNKVLVRVGGGWQDLELFLLHQAIHY